MEHEFNESNEFKRIIAYMKAFIINNFYLKEEIGGSEVQCYLITKYLAKLGHQTTYVAAQGKRKSGEEAEDGFKVHYLTKTDENKLKIPLRFYKLLKKEKPDICYIRIFKFLFFFNLVCKLFRIPIIFNTSNIRDCQPDLAQKFGWTLKPSLSIKYLKSLRINLLRYLNFRIFKRVKVVTINKHHAELLKEQYNVQATPIYNSMEDHYQQNITQKQKQIVWINTIKERKQPEEFIKLADEFKDSGYKFLMIGEFQNRVEYYKQKIRECEENNSNFKHTSVTNPDEGNKILAASQIYVNTCLPEGFGNTFIMAWFNECPTITLSFDPDNIIENNKIGYHSRNFEQMVKDLRKLMDNQDLIQAMGKRARDYALQNHSILSNIKKYEELFEKLKIKN